MLYLGNAFSLQMLQKYPKCTIHITLLQINQIVAMLKSRPYAAVIGHADTAAVAEKKLAEAGLELPCEGLFKRQRIVLTPQDEYIVFQLVSGRLPEGCNTLPVGAIFEWYYIRIIPAP